MVTDGNVSKHGGKYEPDFALEGNDNAGAKSRMNGRQEIYTCELLSNETASYSVFQFRRLIRLTGEALHEESNDSYQFELRVDGVPHLPFTASGKHPRGRRIRSRELVVLQRAVPIESQEVYRRTRAVCKAELACRICCKLLTPNQVIPKRPY